MPDDGEYDVFRRRDGSARRTRIRRAISLTEARDLCEIGNRGIDRKRSGYIFYEFLGTRYNVFRQRVWKKNRNVPGGWESYSGGRKTFLAKGVSWDEAVRMQTEANAGKDSTNREDIIYEVERQ